MLGDDGVDDVLEAIGFGWWLSPVLAVVVVANMVSIHMILSIFTSAPMAFRCLPLEADAYHSHLAYVLSGSNISDNDSNGDVVPTPWYDSKCLESSDPKRNVSLELFISSSSSPVVIHLDPWRHATVLPSCPVIEYDRSRFTSTIVSEFDLVCEKSHMQPLFQMMITVGALIGCSVVGQLGHSLGRKRTMQMGVLLGLPACVGVAFVPRFSMILLLRVVIGIAGRMVIIGSSSLTMEIIPLRYRTIVCMFMGIPPSMFMLLYAIAAYFVREWRYLQLICTLPYLLALPLSFTLDESPRWLMQKGRWEEAMEILKRASELNQSPIPPRLLLFLENLKQKPESIEKGKPEGRVVLCERLRGVIREVGQYWQSPAMALIMVVTSVLLFLLNFTFSGIIFNINTFTSTNSFMFMGLMGTFGIISLLLATPITQRVGRRPYIGVVSFVSGTLLVLETVVSRELTWVRWTVILSGYFLINGVWQVAVTYVPELYPTIFRTQGVSIAIWMATLGVLVAPLATDLVKGVSWGPSVLLGSICIMASFFLPLLPETNKRPLPETIQDVEIRHKDKSGNQLTKSTTSSVV